MNGLQDAAKMIIRAIGENADREGLKKTPQRVEEAWRFITSGYNESLGQLVNEAVFVDEENNAMIVVQNIEFYSLCEHHLLPFYGKCDIGYIPNGRIIGLSKIPRLVDMFSRRLQVQERLTHQVAYTLQKIIRPMGVGVVIEARHLCSMMRGVQKQNSSMVTSAMLGEFLESTQTRMEFMSLIGRQPH